MEQPREDDQYVYAVNAACETRKLSKRKYPNHQLLKAKCASLVGYPTVIRTSQNTSDWSTSAWFSDVSLDDQNAGKLSISGSDQEIESQSDLITKISQLNQKMNSIDYKLQQHISIQEETSERQGKQLQSEKIRALLAEARQLKSEQEKKVALKNRAIAETQAIEANKQTDKAIDLARNANARANRLREENQQLRTEKEQLIEELQRERRTLPKRDKENISEIQRKLQAIPNLIGYAHQIQLR